MNITEPLQLLGGISPEQFMQRYWHRKPLLIRQAIPGFSALLSRAELLDLAERDDVESRLIVQPHQGKPWQFKRGPLVRRSLPPFKQAGWTFLVQGVDLHDQRIHDLLQQFRFVPDARLDDLMISYATDIGGVGPHFDNYDVFLLQAHGQRRWRIGRQKDKTLLPDLPLKILAQFEPEQEFVLEPGDMLYLPPGYAHDGIAQGECMTYSVGFRSPNSVELARELLQRMADAAQDCMDEKIYRDPQQEAVTLPAAMPAQLQAFATEAVEQAVFAPDAIARALGEYMTEPKALVWFEEGQALDGDVDVALDRRTHMMYDERHVFINGESYVAKGRDFKLMQKLANDRVLSSKDVKLLSAGAKELLSQWAEDGWVCSLA